MPIHMNDFESKTEKQNAQENSERSRRKVAGSLVVSNLGQDTFQSRKSSKGMRVQGLNI